MIVCRAELAFMKGMRRTEHLLDRLAQEQDTVVSNLRLVTYYRHNAILKLLQMPNKDSVSLLEWSRTLSYLAEVNLSINSYGEVDAVLYELSKSSWP